MKKISILILFLILLASSCTNNSTFCAQDVKLCEDGTYVSRDPTNNCEFKSCPETINCDYKNQCPEGYNCYSFPEDEDPICYIGDPCERCASKNCDITESFPMQVFCK